MGSTETYFALIINLLNTGTTIIASAFSSEIIQEQNHITITCQALGYPPPIVVWSKTSETLNDRVSVSDTVSFLTGNGNVTRVSVNLTITNASREDTGVYTCSANNSIGSDERNVTIIIQCKFELSAY